MKLKKGEKMNIKELNERLQKVLVEVEHLSEYDDDYAFIREELSQGSDPRLFNVSDAPHVEVRKKLGHTDVSKFLGYAFDLSDIKDVNDKIVVYDNLSWARMGKTFENLPKGIGYFESFGASDCSIYKSLRNADIIKEIDISGIGCHGSRDFDLSWLPRNFSGVLKLTDLNIKTLKGCPQNIKELHLEGYDHGIRGLTNLEGCPQNLNVLRLIDCEDLTSLQGISKNIGTLELSGNSNLNSWEGVEIDSIKDYKASRNGKLTIKTAPDIIKQLVNNKKEMKLNKQQEPELSLEELKIKGDFIKKKFPQAVRYKRAGGLKFQVSFREGRDSESIIKRAEEVANKVGARLEVEPNPNYGLLIINFFI